MSSPKRSLAWMRTGMLLAISLLLLIVWGCAGVSKVREGYPSWFDEKFGSTFLASFPGLRVTFWWLTVTELAAALLVLASLLRLEFLARRPPLLLLGALTLSLFVFVELSLGQWLTREFEATFQMFTYFCGTLVMWRLVAEGVPDARG